MTERSLVILILFLMALTLRVHAQQLSNGLDQKIPVDLLKEDFATLRSRLQSTQPALDLYITKDSLDSVFNKINESFTEPLTSIEFFRRIAPLNGILRNLHTHLWPSAAYAKAMKAELPRFPIDIHWLDNKMYVLRNNSDNGQIQEGSIIKTINGKRSGIIFQEILDCQVRDGFNESFPVAYASRNFSSCYGEHIGTPETFTLEITTPAGSHETIEVKAVKASQINDRRVSKYERKYSRYSEDWDAWIANKEPALRFELKEDVAILTPRTFGIYIIERNGQKYEEFLNQAFAQLVANNTKHLIIDMRNTHGGHDLVGMFLMSHLHDSTFYYYKRRTTIVKPMGKSVKKGNTYEIIGRRGWIGKVNPAKEIYTGAVYVLMNGYSVSAAGEFIGHLKNINRAIFVGEEAGGNPVTFIGGQSQLIDLPHTRITGVIPLSLNEMNVRLQNNGHGVMADYEIRASITEILAGRDVEMEFTLELIRNRQR